jgi:NIMA (never in mitosis gene a)-related kinase
MEKFTGVEFAVKMMEAATEKSFSQIQKEFLILNFIPPHPNII